jgi:uncharacterized membrane protein YdjX (TVP38/TMEM64 family)
MTPPPSRSWPKVAAAALAVAAVLGAFHFLPISAWIERLKSFVEEHGALGVVVFGLAYVVAGMIPGGPASAMTIAAGAIFGIWKGTLLVSAASMVVAVLAFLLARTVLRARIEKRMQGNAGFERLQRAIEKRGARVVVLVRLSPLFPFTLSNYALGLSALPLSTYALASWLAMLPGTIAYVYLGATVGAVSTEGDARSKGIRIAFAVVGIIATVVIARFAKRALDADAA